MSARRHFILNEVKNVERQKVPSIRILPVGGFLIRNLDRIHKKYPEIVKVRMGIASFYLLSGPELIQEVLVTKQRDFIKGRFLQRTKQVFGEGLLTSEGDFHHRQRRLVQPAFHHDRINSYAELMTSYSKRTMSSWKDGETLDIHGEMMRLTMAIVAKCLFDADIESESKSIARDLTTTIEYFNRLSSPISGLLRRLPTNRKYVNSVNRIDSLVYKLIEGRRKSGEDTGDLMSMFLRAKDESGNAMSDAQLRDEVLILFAAGHETTANALTWSWYLISENPDVERKIHEEVDSLFPDGYLPKAEDFPKLEYTTKVLTESMRIYPPAWVLVRQALHECNLGDHVLPTGADVIISPFLAHHDSRFFPEPEKFDPDRWTPDMRKSLPKFAYFPFGAGPRSCVGEPFAWMEGVVLIAAIASKWSLMHAKDHRVEMLPRITLRPRYGMKMVLRKR